MTSSPLAAAIGRKQRAEKLFRSAPNGPAAESALRQLDKATAEVQTLATPLVTRARRGSVNGEARMKRTTEPAGTVLTTVRMIVVISGTRDGVEWPGYGELLETTETEAADLIATGKAIDPNVAPVERSKVWAKSAVA